MVHGAGGSTAYGRSRNLWSPEGEGRDFAFTPSSPTGLSLGLTIPHGPCKTETRSRSYFVGGAASSEAHRPAREALSEFFRQVVQEDFAVMEGVQKMAPQRQELGMQTRFSGYWEKSLHQFQRYYAERMGGAA